ncbi:hypothetical protein MC885_001800 [Smutsia gigantea]|nr:hypothetical protein MC885_001800 [Smutsia gigantea]
MEDLEQIFLRSWRESHLTEIRQYQQAPPQPFPPAPSAAAPVTSAQLPWLAGLAASSCNDSVHIIECTYSLAEGLSEMFRLLIEGKLAKTNYVVIICACRNTAIDSCIAVTGEPGPGPPLGEEQLYHFPSRPPLQLRPLGPRRRLCVSAGAHDAAGAQRPPGRRTAHPRAACGAGMVPVLGDGELETHKPRPSIKELVC